MTDQIFQSGRVLAGSTAIFAQNKSVTAPATLIVFMIALVMPVTFDFVGFKCSPARLFLLIMFVPTLLHLFSGKVGKVHLVDGAMFLFSAWILITLIYHQGLGKLAYSAISVVELLGGYLLGRTMIRTAADFRFLIKCQLGVMLFLLPFAAIDFMINNQLLSKFLDMFGDAAFRGSSSHPRGGYQRVLTGFDHPILYGLFCSMAAANVVYIWRDKLIWGFGWLGFVIFMTLMSLSSGAFLSVIFQSCLVTWDFLTRSKWWLLTVLFISAILILSFGSDRGPIILLIETMTFNSGTGWTRVIQWEYGSAEVMRNPLWGKGLTADWIRPSWLYTSSIDNYWLVIAFRHGLPGIILLGIVVIGAFTRIVRAKNLGPNATNIRTGYLITFVGVCFTLGTVHIWNSAAIYVYCYIGAGLWLATNAAQNSDDAPAVQPRRLSRHGRATELLAPSEANPNDPSRKVHFPYSRFPVKPNKRADK